MAWIKTIDEQNAEGFLREAYDFYMDQSKCSSVANILKIHGLSPRSLKLHFTYYFHMLFGKGPLRRYQREMIGTYVSVLNRCHY